MQVLLFAGGGVGRHFLQGSFVHLSFCFDGHPRQSCEWGPASRRGHKESVSGQLVAETLGQVVDKLVDPRGVDRNEGKPEESRGLQVQGCTAFFEENSG